MNAHTLLWWQRRISFLGCVLALVSIAPRGSRAAPSDETRTITGHVLTPDNTPAAGASVRLIFFNDEHYRELGATTTDAEGRFHFDEPPVLPTKARTLARALQFYARLPGVGVAVREIISAPDEIEIRLEPAVDLKVRVTNPHGKPLAGVALRVDRVMYEHDSWTVSLPPLEISRFGAISDARGNAVIHGLPANRGVFLAFDEQHSATSVKALNRWIQLGDGPEKVVTEPYIAAAPATVAGRVRYEGTGAPAAGIGVMASEPHGGEFAYVDTNSEGKFEFKGLPPGSFDLSVVPRGDMRDWVAKPQDGKPVKAGERLDGQDLTLIKGGLITGRVTGAADGRGVPGLVVEVTTLFSAYRGQECKTDADGRYQLRAPAGEKRVYLARGSMPEGYNEPKEMSVDVKVIAGETITADISLPPDTAEDYISGQIVDREGKPVEKTHVLVISDKKFDFGPPEAFSDGEGKFRIKLQAQDGRSETMKVLASHPQSGVTAGPVEIRRGGDAIITLDPAGFASTDFRVTDIAGHPIRRAQVSVSGILGSYYYVEQRFVPTDPEGRCQLTNLWPGARYFILTEAKGFGATDDVKVITVPGENKHLPDIPLEPANQAITGRMVDPNGRRVAGADINADSSFLHAHTKTDVRGNFHLDNLNSGWFWLEVDCGLQMLPVARAKGGSRDVVVEKPAQVDDVIGSEATKTLATHLIGKRAPMPMIDPKDWVGPRLPGDLATALKGKVVLLDFWELSSEPCLDEMPKIEAFYQANKSSGLLVLGVGASSYPAAEVREVLARRKLQVSYPLARDARGGLGKTEAAYGVADYPCYAVIDRQGVLAYLGREWAEAKAKAEALSADFQSSQK